jgi:serine/threonine protein phosphatase PrpC
MPPLNRRPSTTGSLSQRQSNARNDLITETATLECDGLLIRYACLSQRGYYPDELDKVNQDAFCLHPKLTSFGDAFLGIFDGHGQDGEGCAQFARTHLPQQLETALNHTRILKKRTALRPDDVHDAITTAHLETNRTLRQDPQVDASLSGTTAVSLYIHGHSKRITISNVGDSRAVLGRLSSSLQNPDISARTFKALPLSYDHTPYRKDERTRILKTGARILSLDQLEGLEPIHNNNTADFDLDEVGDPPRVWSAKDEGPGTAFTRSIGDAVAEDLGVYAQPEMLTHNILAGDKILVLATDGVFEFLTNQSVIDICAKFTNPLEACRAVVAEAYELWLQYELRTDDITILIAFVDNANEGDELENEQVDS